jgi:hypothetical protein
LKKILKVVCKEALLLTNVPKVLSAFDAKEMIRRLGFYDRYKNSEGKGLAQLHHTKQKNA